MPTRRSGKGQESLPEVRERSEVLLGCSVGVGRPTVRSGKGRESHLDIREGLGGLLGRPGGVWEVYP